MTKAVLSIASFLCLWASSPSATALELPSQSGYLRSSVTILFGADPKEWPSSLGDLRARMDARFSRGLRGTSTATIFHSNAPASTSPTEPRLLYVTPGSELYIGAIPRTDGSIELEFISWNRTANQYDFGLIRNFGKAEAVLDLADRNACLQCHRHGGPIFSVFPWINVAPRPSLLAALSQRDSRYTQLQPLLGTVVADLPKGILGAGQEALLTPLGIFFKHHPSLSHWNGIFLESEENFQNEIFLVERSLTSGAVRAIVAAALKERPTRVARRDFLLRLLRRHLLTQAAHLDKSESPLSLEDELLDRELAAHPLNRPILFPGNLGPDRRLTPNDFLENTRPFISSAAESEPQHDILTLPVLNTVSRMTDPLFLNQELTPDGALDRLFRRQFPDAVREEGRIFRIRTSQEKEFVQRTFERLGNSAPLLALAEEDSLPTHSEVSQAVEAGLLMLLGTPRLVTHVTEPEVKLGNGALRPQANLNRPCLSCHLNYTGRLRFAFDPASPEAWNREVAKASAPEGRNRLRAFQSRVRARLLDEDAPMPPEDALREREVFSEADRASLLRFLNELRIP